MEKERESVVAEIRAMYPNVDWPDPIEDVVYVGRRELALLENHKAIRDQKTGLVYAIASDKYNLVFHEEMVKIVHETLSDPMMDAFGKPEITISILADGGKMKFKARFPEVQYEIRKGDFINPTASFMNSYDLGWKARCIFGAFRLVCTNGMTVGKKFSSFIRRHMPSLKVGDMTKNLVAGMNAFSEQTELWKKMGDVKITLDKYAQIFEDLGISDKRKEEIEKIPEQATRLLLPDAVAKDTLDAWTFYNVLTQFSTHNLQSEMARTDFEESVANVFERRILN